MGSSDSLPSPNIAWRAQRASASEAREQLADEKLSQRSPENPGGGVLPYVCYIGTCGPKGCGFSAVFVINRLSILVLNRVWFLYSILELGMLFRRSYFFIIIDKTISKSPSELMFRATVSDATVINRLSNFWSGHE